MAILSTGPVQNNPVSGVRPTQQVTIRLVSRAAVDSLTVSVQGYALGTSRTLYVNEVISIAPNEVVTRSYFADLDAYEFVFETSMEGLEEVGVSVWGKQASGQLVEAHRVVVHEKTLKDI
ncbi:hypothetical protein TCA2_3248 [Paenibacillus sp. TCA20]|uniref:Uncharacterized protein n=1 Tax=Paenibacillus urinalis TaxID=521520 RepID=A0AAX3MT60_9BACL|nr:MULTISPECIES: hypothetical protein [Paenibacillus]WDH80563.1 hypothetical protein PUW23_13425 [Paenibacillus urinalis]GAK40758.1 hypothetical protein TCA2_3248 [Paenibacillus sp. TCA20]